MDKKNEDYVVRMPEDSFGKGEKDAFIARSPRARSPARRSHHDASAGLAQLEKSPGLSIMSYCLSSISMTVVNKYVVSGTFWNLNFFYLAVQVSLKCLHSSLVDVTDPVLTVGYRLHSSHYGMQTNRPYQGPGAFRSRQSEEVYVKPVFSLRCIYSLLSGFPISLLLVGMIYTSTKALQFLSVPVYTIFKNLTIIVIAYGEVLWFGGSVTPMALLSFGLMVLSSIVAAWADIQSAIAGDFGFADSSAAMSTLNAGYAWMGLNVFCSASYVLGMRKVIKKMNFKDWDSKLCNQSLKCCTY